MFVVVLGQMVNKSGHVIVCCNALEYLSGVSLVVLCQNHLYNCSSRCFGVL